MYAPVIAFHSSDDVGSISVSVFASFPVGYILILP